MKKLYVLIGLSLMMACHEAPPQIDYGPGVGNKTLPIAKDTTYIAAVEAPQPKVVVMEEFTGVKCTNCPEAQEVIKGLLESHGKNLLVVSYHTTKQAIPYTGEYINKYDFRTEQGQLLHGQLLIAGLPQATIDRKLFDGLQELSLFKGEWITRTESQLSANVPANIYIETYFDEADQTLYAAVTVKLLEDIIDPINITVGVSQDSIIDVQGSKDVNNYPPKGIIKDYTHRHVFRGMMSGWHGSPFSAPDQKAGRVLTKRFAISFAGKDWNHKDCSVFAFVHYTGASEEILQATEKHVD